jgi:RluA family pseudouridine synthase
LTAPERIPVKSDAYGMRLLDFLERRWPDVHRAYFRRLVLAEMVKVNRIIGTPYTTLRQGDIIDITRPQGTPPPKPKARLEAAPEPRVVHSDDDIVVIDKPSQVTLEAALTTLASAVPAAAKPVLRIDAEASGLAVLAPTAAAHQALTEAFARGDLEVHWQALVEQRVQHDTLVLDKALGPDRNHPGRVRVYAPDAKKARPAQTLVRVLEAFDRHTLLDAVPRTDRGHQLRVHLAATHHPVVGDAIYGSGPALLVSHFKRRYRPRVGVQERPIVARLCLHASRLLWRRDACDTLEVTSPLPKAITAALVRLRRYAEH